MAEEPIVNVPHPENFSWQPLHLLAFHGDVDGLARLDSDAHALLSPRTLDVPTGGWGGGKTPLALAAERGQAAAVAWLLARGADPTLVTPDGLSPLALAARGGHVAALRALLVAAGGGQGVASPDRRWRLLAQADRWGRVPLMVAAAHGQAGALACLLDAALEVEGRDRAAAVLERAYCTGEAGVETSTLLAYACRRGDAVTAATLLERGASPYLAGSGDEETAGCLGSATPACAAVLEEWDRRYALAAARAAEDAARTAQTKRGGDHQRRAASADVLTAAVSGMDDDVFSIVVGLLGKSAKAVAAEEEEEESDETEKVEEVEEVSMMEEGDDDEEEGEAWDW